MTILLLLLILPLLPVLFFGCRWEWQREQEWKRDRFCMDYELANHEPLDTWHRLPAIRKEGDRV